MVCGFLAAALLALAGCRPSNDFSVKGRIVGFSDDSNTVIVAHEDVAGLMPAMTMPFRATNAGELSGFDLGDVISFRLHVTQDSSWIDAVEKLPNEDLATPPRRTVTVDGAFVLVPGETIPSLALINQRNEPVEFFELGTNHVYVLDFIYTRCPIPEFCPMLSRKFAEMQAMIQSNESQGIHLASVTVDPEFDSPTVLLDYAKRYAASDEYWNFFSGRQTTLDSLYTYLGVSLFDSPEDPVVHAMVVAVVRGDGRLMQIWRDGEWSAAEVLMRARGVIEPRRP